MEYFTRGLPPTCRAINPRTPYPQTKPTTNKISESAINSTARLAAVTNGIVWQFSLQAKSYTCVDATPDRARIKGPDAPPG